MDKENLTLLTDLYQLTMMQGYLDSGIHQKEVVFDLFYRQNPCENGFAITAGLQQAIEYIKNICPVHERRPDDTDFSNVDFDEL